MISGKVLLSLRPLRLHFGVEGAQSDTPLT